MSTKKEAGVFARLRARFGDPPRVTFAGYNLLFVTAAAGFLGWAERNEAVLGVFSVLGGVVIVSYVLCWYSLAGLSLQRYVSGSFTAGELFVIEYRLRNRKLFFPAFHLLIIDCCANSVFRSTYYNFKAEVGLVPPGGESFGTCSARIKERGVLDFDRVYVFTRFPFGLFCGRRGFSVPCRVYSYPRCRTIRPRAVFAGEVTGYTEWPSLRWERGYDVFMGVREYRWGDNPRWIDWKTSAKYRRNLRVREFATTEEREIFVIFDPVSGWISRKSKNVKFELALVYAVSLVKYFLQKGNEVTFYTLHRGFVEIPKVRSWTEFRKVLARAAEIREVRGIDFYRHVSARSGMIKRSGAGVVVVGAGIRAMYEDLFRGSNVKVVDLAEEKVSSLFPARRIVV